MKKITILSAVMLITLFSCNKEEEGNTNDKSSYSVVERKCAAYDVHQEQLKQNPQLAIKMDEIETFTKKFIEKSTKEGKLVNGKIEIPVTVNVLYRTEAENISLAQIQSQIDVLNKDFNAANIEFNSVPPAFEAVKANIGINFVLANVVRKSCKMQSWGTNDSMKREPKGIAPTTPTTNLNIWACTIGGGIIGYAQFPGGALATDGVVVDSHYFGTVGTATAPYALGRTATHEIGHWMNLRHIWGDTKCGNDFVADTPLHDGPNYGTPVYPHYSTCIGNPIEMTMNYMDYTNDGGMYMFSEGQKQRMLPIFSQGGPRYSFAQP